MLEVDIDRQYHTYRGNNWAFKVKSLLEECGLMYIWNNRYIADIPIDTIRQRLYHIYYQQWYSDVHNSRRLSSYSLYKTDLKLESYLENVTVVKHRIALSKFRVSSHKLAIETGRYYNIPNDERLCMFCNMRAVETEYHLLLVCPYYTSLRRKYLKPYFCRWPSLVKFKLLLSTKSIQINLAKYLFFAMRLRGN